MVAHTRTLARRRAEIVTDALHAAGSPCRVDAGYCESVGDESAVTQARAGRGVAACVALAAVRGVFVGIASAAAGLGAAVSVVKVGESNGPEGCGSDLACLPDLGSSWT